MSATITHTEPNYWTHPIPDAALETHIGVLGKTGSGKTFTARGLVERLLDAKRHVAVIDPTGAWYGLRTGFDIPIFGGRHGDIEISDAAGEAVAGVIDEQRTSAIVDLSLMSGGAQQRFMRGFAKRLRAKQPGSFWLVIDEADEFLPQHLASDQTNAFGDLKWMVRRGRLNGFRVMMITQRPAEIAKAVLTQIETLVAHRLTAPQDRKAIEEWVKGHHDPAEAREVLSTLASLGKGEAWVWCPDQGVLQRSTMPANRTFDSGRTPEPGETVVAPPALAALDLSAIREALKPADQPVDYGKIASPFSSDLARATATSGELTKLKAELEAMEKRALAAESMVNDFLVAFRNVKEGICELGDTFGMVDAVSFTASQHLEANGWEKPSGVEFAPADRPMRASAAEEGVSAARVGSRSGPEGGRVNGGRRQSSEPPQSGRGLATPAADGSLSGPQLHLLAAIAWWTAKGHPAPSKAQVAGIAGWKITSGHLKNVAGSLRSKGLIAYPDAGRMSLTAAGELVAPKPDQDASLQDQVRSSLSGPQRTVFDLLRHHEELPRDQLARQCGWEPTSGHVKNVLGSLRTLEIVHYPGPGFVKLADWLFDERSRT